MSLRIKLLLPFVIFLVCSLLFLQFVWLPAYIKYEENDLLRQEQYYLELLSTALLPDLLTGDLAKIHNTLDSIVRERDYWHSIILTNASGVRLYPLETEVDEPNMENMFISSHILNFQKNRVVEIKAVMHFDKLIAKKVQRIRRVGFSLIGIIAIMAFFIIFFQDISIRRPLARLADASVQIAEGSYDAVLPPPSADEIGRFSRAFGKMQQTLETRESELTLSRKRLASIIDNSVDAIINIDTKGIILSVNKAVETILGYRQEELLGRNINILMPEPYRLEHDDYLKKYLETGQAHIIGIGREVIGVHKNGSRIELYLAVSEVHVENQVIFTGIIRDISLQKETEGFLKQAKEEAEHANRAKSAFLANMSHEIRTPMNAVLGFSELLSSLVIDEKQKQYLKAIMDSGKGLLTIINDILDLSKIEAGKLEFNYAAVDLGHLLDEVRQIFMPVTRTKGIRFQVRLGPGLDPIVLDEIRLRQILLNLVGNAVKFTPKGQIGLTADLVEAGSIKDNQGRDLHIRVKDTGVGIPKNRQDDIFKAFEQQEGDTAKHYGGTGLGLTITRRLVHMMNGSISLESSTGKGSEFLVVLRAVTMADQPGTIAGEASPVGSAGPASPAPGTRFKPATILVVDDVASNRDLVREFLGESPIKVVEADNGRDALDMIRESVPDLVILDIRMPGMDGYGVLKEIRNDPGTGDLPVICLTASLTSVEQAKIDFSGFDLMLSKPLFKKDLNQALGRFLAQDSPEGSPEPNPLELDPLESDPLESDDSRLGGSFRVKRETIKNPKGLIQTLDNLYENQWRTFSGVLEVDGVEVFGHTLADLGKTHNADTIIQYGNQLIQAAQHVDIDQIQSRLETFPALVSSYRGTLI